MNRYAVAQGTEALFVGSYDECLAYLKQQYGKMTFEQFIKLGITMKPVLHRVA